MGSKSVTISKEKLKEWLSSLDKVIESLKEETKEQKVAK